MITYFKPVLSDICLMQNLVSPQVQSGVILHRSDDEIATNIRSYILAKNADTLVGFGALHIHSTSLAEIRSLIVDENYRGSGIGANIVKKLIKESMELGIKKIFTLTYRKSFFENLGFIEISKTQLPSQKIWADCIKCKHFPVCDEIALIYQI